MPLRLYLDENVDTALASALRRRNFDVVTARDKGMLGASDADHLALATVEGRAIVTHDIGDFIKLHVEALAQGREHHGIIVSNMLGLPELLHRILRMSESLPEEEMQNRLLFLHRFKD